MAILNLFRTTFHDEIEREMTIAIQGMGKAENMVQRASRGGAAHAGGASLALALFPAGIRAYSKTLYVE
jgi:hypothetical protein